MFSVRRGVLRRQEAVFLDFMRVQVRLLGAWSLFDTTDTEARFQRPAGEPAAIHFQRIACRTSGAMTRFGLRLHVLDIQNTALLIKKGDRER